MYKKKFVFDAILNIIATSIPILLLQIVTLPIVGARLGDDKYGLVITLISLFTLLSLSFGNVLNNIRLLLDNEYKQKNITGDFNILLVASIILSSFLTILGTLYYEGEFSFINIVLMLLITCFSLMREYLLVSFRLTLNYKAILSNNIILGIGYIMGTLLFYVTGVWQLIYVFGLGFSLFYIIKKSNLLKEPLTMSKLFRKTTYKSIILFCSAFLKSTLSYADKLLLFPLLGPTAVSIYYSATIIGKLILMIITPVNGVMLSYLTRVEKIGRKKLFQIMAITCIVGGIGYLLTIQISFPLLNLLYPKWAEESMELIYITSGSAILGVLSSVLQPFNLKFNNLNWQLIINGTNLIVYIICSFILYRHFGLIGFCVGALISNFFRFVFMIYILIINMKSVEKAAPSN